MVAIAENARIPIDNPATHLELTMVHEAMVLEYSGRHLALIELSSALKLLLYVSLIGCLFAPWGIAGPDASAQALAIGVAVYLGKARGRRLPAGRVRDGHRQDARVPGAGIPRRGADARPARHACCCSSRGASKNARHHLRHRSYAGRLAGAGELHAALPGPALRAAQHLRAACPGAGAVGRLAGLHPGCAASLSDGDDRAGVQGHRHSGGAAPDHRAARHPPRDRNRGRRRPRHAARHGAGRARPWW